MRAIGAVLMVLTLSCGGPRELPAVPAAPALAAPAAPTVWPLRGTSASDADATRRRPLIVKVANDAAARPQTGIATADVVLEIPVEGGITRYALVFQSQDPDRVGPVRSARQSDLNYLAMLRAIVVHVGASEPVAKMVREASRGGAFIDVDEFEHPEAFERTSDKPAPYNAYSSAAKIRQAAGEHGREKVDVPALAFDASVKDKKAESQSAGTSLTIAYESDAQRTKYEYDASSGGYHRTQGGQKTTDRGREVLPDNIVVIKTDVDEIVGTADVTGAPSVNYRSTGSGAVIVLRDGKRFEGTWSRQGNDMYRFTDGTGATIALKAGLTWIHIVPAAMSLD